MAEIIVQVALLPRDWITSPFQIGTPVYFDLSTCIKLFLTSVLTVTDILLLACNFACAGGFEMSPYKDSYKDAKIEHYKALSNRYNTAA